MSAWWGVGGLAFVVAYWWTVLYRARLLSWTKFCQDVKHCKRKHRVVIVAPPNKPMRAVLKHV